MLLSYFSLWYLKDVCSKHCLNVLVPALLLELSHQCHNLSDECDLKDLVCSLSSRHIHTCHLWEACENQIMAVTGIVWICCCSFYYWVLYLWWLTDLCFNILETFHFIWQISSMLQALIKGSFYNLKLWLVIRLSYPYDIVCPTHPPSIASQPPAHPGTILILGLSGGWRKLGSLQ